MNKQTIPVQHPANVSTTTISSQGSNTQPQLDADKTFLARNIVIKPDSIQMEVALEGRWQPVRLSSEANIDQVLKLPEAQLKLDATGTVLTLVTPEAKLSLKSAQSLLSLLGVLKGFGDHSAIQTDAQIKQTPHSQLALPKLGVNVPIPPSIGNLLQQESKLVASLSAKSDKVLMQVFNMFGDKLHQMPVAKKAIAKLVSQLSQQTSNYLQLTQNKGTLKLGRHQHDITQIQTPTPTELKQLQKQVWHGAKLSTAPDGIEVAIATKSTKIKLATSLKSILPKLDTHAFQTQLKEATQSYKEQTLKYDKPLFNVSLADIKQTVKQALQAITQTPFFNRTAQQDTNRANQHPAQQIPSITATAKTYLHQPLYTSAALRPASLALMTLSEGIKQNFSGLDSQNQSAMHKQGLVSAKNQALQSPFGGANATEQQKAKSITPDNNKPNSFALQGDNKQSVSTTKTQATPPVNALQSAQSSAAKIPFEMRLQLIQQVLSAALPKNNGPITAEQLSMTQTKLATQMQLTDVIPLRGAQKSQNAAPASLPLAHILSKPLREAALTQTQTPDLKDPALLSEKISEKMSFKSSQSVDLTRLVHQAFSRLMDEGKATPDMVSQDLFSRLPNIATPLNTSVPMTSFTQALDKLLVTLLGTQLSSQNEAQLPKNVSQEQRIASMVETLFPGNKLQQPKQFIQAVNLSAQQNLVEELSFIQNAMSPTNQTQALGQKFDSESQLLINLFLPMKTPPECRQSELQIGNYKKPAKAGLPEKQVWFVRLNFDYEALGQLSVQAELMDKAVDCEIVGDSPSVCQLAEPHLDALRSKLAAHGLQVGDIALREDAVQVKQFYDKHAIVNIKV
ncbi:flagellar hook-length control protein FliK [Pseudoalteromonas umbrosa]|uniref:flagellar hook-length control protein FliK n=1 Tax=Pseudoalteromonas umbrosa TaxID=3048489 RepID=UPI0024C2F9F5|nr:flagellar hook-length control protein FliK [Pseudoalteromonas sp. B95]MDK1285669.1 flagellar hook-length control protein FliK [Pseudoalteromonas sp. B95]